MTDPCCLPVGVGQTSSSHIFITTRFFLITVGIATSPGQVVCTVWASVVSTMKARRQPTWYLRSTSLIILKLGDRMPGSNHFHTCRVNVSKISLSIKVNCYAIHTTWSLYLNCPMITMCSRPMRPPREGERGMGRMGCNRVSPLYPATLE